MTAEASVVSGIAGRYATALFELARDKNALDEIAGDLADIATMIDDSADLNRLLRSPVIGREDQAKGIAAVLQRAGASDLTGRFVAVVAENRLLFALRDMARAFRGLLAAHRGEVTAEVVSAHALNDDQLATVKVELAAAMKTEVQVEASVDEGILGGMIVRVGSRMVDSSLRTKLQNLGFAMRGVE